MQQRLNGSGGRTENSTRGLVIINTGKGKGKTTAALGLLLRAWGRDMRVAVLQFMKSSTANYGEHRAARRMGIEILARGTGFAWQTRDTDRDRSLAGELWSLAREKIASGAYHMVILDELSYPVRYGWIPVDTVLEVLRNRPNWVHVVITGRDVPQELIDLADVVTEMKEIKHPLHEGIKAQPGIEF
ncbi:MAG TPA: cob(I)yrinic acid a,c-diamide adenosyltransferase [Dehalococcoidia bacterium]|jgi:cob(I)alamin adenosyltransferase|nr:cob(I)yrinic acid a,c-diamide adenosyltransferase [Dehalococcoidia bacterium]